MRAQASVSVLGRVSDLYPVEAGCPLHVLRQLRFRLHLRLRLLLRLRLRLRLRPLALELHIGRHRRRRRRLRRANVILRPWAISRFAARGSAGDCLGHQGRRHADGVTLSREESEGGEEIA
jgi:hypothetical protein